MIFCVAVCACVAVNCGRNRLLILLYVVFVNAVNEGTSVKRSEELSADKMFLGFCLLSTNCETVVSS